MKKRSQISFEYLILIGFLTFVIIVIFSIAFFYLGSMREKIRSNMLTDCGNKIVSSSETMFYAGFPSRTIVRCNLQDNINEIKSIGYDLVVNVSETAGISVLSFTTTVPLVTKPIATSGGNKKFLIEATPSAVNITSI